MSMFARWNVVGLENGTVQYILLIYGDERVWASMPKDDVQRVHDAHMAYIEELQKAGVMRGGAELKLTSTAASVRFESGAPKVLDGPFAETKEQLGGYYLIETATREEAVEWARKMPAMTDGTVEVRPLGSGG